MRILARFESSALQQLAKRLKGFEDQSELAGALNTAGEALRNATVTAETKQTGLPHDTIERAQQPRVSVPGRLIFSILAHGGNVRLKYFGAKEVPGGVTARPWDVTHLYPGTFITSGRNPRGAVSRLGGQVFTPLGVKNASRKNTRWGKGRSIGSWWQKIEVERSGLFIPTEMTRGHTEAVFEADAKDALDRLEAKLLALLRV